MVATTATTQARSRGAVRASRAGLREPARLQSVVGVGSGGGVPPQTLTTVTIDELTTVATAGGSQGRGTPPSDRSRCCLRPSRVGPPWPGASVSFRYRHVGNLATGMAPTLIAMKIHIASDLVGDTGIEPVTSSV